MNAWTTAQFQYIWNEKSDNKPYIVTFNILQASFKYLPLKQQGVCIEVF